MNPMQTTKGTRKSRACAAIAASAGLVLALTLPSAFAQNAAQLAALAHLGRANVQAQPNTGSSVEAANTPLDQPGGLAFDAAGNLYIADTSNNIVREVDLTGLITTVAGTGAQGFSGDGGSATSAMLDSPAGVTVDSQGNIYIADTNNNRIREVSGGVIATIAGTGAVGFSGDGGAATSATMSGPDVVAVNSTGNVYFSDAGNNRIREISGTNIKTVAGNGVQGYSGDGGLATAASLDTPGGIAVDSSFNIYIGDSNNNRIRMVTFATGIIKTIAGTGVHGFNGDGPALTTQFARPTGVALDGSGDVYVANSDNNRIREIQGGNVITVSGNGNQGFSGDTGSSSSASLNTPTAVAVSGTTVAIADTENNRVRAVNSQTVDTVAGSAPTATESLVIGSAITVVYGTGSLTATFSYGGATATGQVTFYDGDGANPALVGTASLSGNAATVSTSLLAAGTHHIVAYYAGDAKNQPIASGVYGIVVTPVQLTAVATTVNLLYGQAVPALTGTLSGVLAQDSGNVTAAFSSAATIISDPGAYPIAVSLAGSAAGNYTVVLGSGSGSVVIAKAPSTTTLATSNGAPVSGTSVTLTAAVASTTSGTPTGTVNFYNGSTLLNSTPVALSGGMAALVVTPTTVGQQSFTAVYSGSVDFIPSNSPALTEAVLSPDFSITASPAVQTVIPGQQVDYTVTLTPVNPTFVYPVSLSASGLPPGVTATFAPASVAAGAGATTSVLTLGASTQARLQRGTRPFSGIPPYSALALLVLPLFFGKRARKAAASLSHTGRILIALLALAAVGAVTGCGGGGFFSHNTTSYTVTVTAVSGPDTHTAVVTLTVQ